MKLAFIALVCCHYFILSFQMVYCSCLFQWYTVVSCRRGDDDYSEVWQTPEKWLETDTNGTLWAYYPFKNRQTCAKNFVDEHDPRGGKQWDKYLVTSLYFPEVHTQSYDIAENKCREIGQRPLTDEET